MDRKNHVDHRAQTIARIKVKGTAFEVLVDTQKAIDFKKTKKGDIQQILIFDGIFRDYKKGIRAGKDELETHFDAGDHYEIAKKIILNGEILVPLELKAKAREEKENQIIEWLARSCTNPQTNLPHPPQRIKSAMDEAGVKIDESKPAEHQAVQIMKLINKILPIKIESRKIAIKIPAMNAAKTYGVIKDVLVKEEWLSDGSLSCIVEVPKASLMAFYDKLNAVTHGTAIAKEI